MKNQKGFIQIPILIAIIAGVLVLSGAGYMSVKKYRNYQFEKTEKEKEAQVQQKAFQEAQQEIEKLKIESEQSKNQQKTLEKKINQEASRPKDTTITASEFAPYLSGVVLIDCNSFWGTGSLWNIKDFGYVAMTNDHVVNEDSYQYGCLVSVYDSSSGSASHLYRIIPQLAFDFNKETDSAFLPIQLLESNQKESPVSTLNYGISSIRKCTTKVLVGTPVAVIGFPAFAHRNIDFKGYNVEANFRQLTTGVISGYDDSVTPNLGGNLPYQNYFISAKIDSGNSGGIAFSKGDSGLCVLGIPTWVALGNYETQGLVQNIHNVFSSE